MNYRYLVPSDRDATKTADRAEIVSRYKRLREVNVTLNQKLVKRLSKDVLDTGGEKLGYLRDGVFVFNSEDESSVLMDYCIYDVRPDGCNAVEQYLIDSPPDPDSEEMACLRAMQHATYSLFVVESVERGLGVTVRDSCSNETILVVDMGFASSAQPGLVFASRLLAHDGFSMTGGAALPIGILPKGQQQGIVERLAASLDRTGNGDFDPARLIRACLSDGSSSRVRYLDSAGRAGGRPPAKSPRPSARVGRNTTCPCGSGKKYKHCCIR